MRVPPGTSLQWLSPVLKVYMEKANIRLPGFAQNSVLGSGLQADKSGFLREPVGEGRRVFGEFARGAKGFQRPLAITTRSAGDGEIAKGPLGFGIGLGRTGEVAFCAAKIFLIESVAAGFERGDENAGEGTFEDQDAFRLFLALGAEAQIARQGCGVGAILRRGRIGCLKWRAGGENLITQAVLFFKIAVLALDSVAQRLLFF